MLGRIAIVVLLFRISVFAETLDIHVDSQACKNHPLEVKWANQIRPIWEPDTSPSVRNPELAEMDHLAHRLNSLYLKNMLGSVYNRLSAAKEAGLDLKPYSQGFARVLEYCSKPDRSGRAFERELTKLAQLPSEVESDYAIFQLANPMSDSFIRRLIVAALEAGRIANLLSVLRPTENSEPVYLVYLHRLLRLQHHYPAIVLNGMFGGGNALIKEIESEMIPHHSVGPKSIYFSDPGLDQKLGLLPAGAISEDLPPIPWASDPSLLPGGETFFRGLYTAILSGRRPIPKQLEKKIRQAVDLSIRESIASAMLKCQNASPCAALSVEPDVAALLIGESQNQNSLVSQSCMCKIGDQHEWVDGRANLALGFVSAAAVVIASLTPINWLAYLGYALAAADSTAAIAGLDDAYINVARTNRVALLRSGGAVDPMQELETQAEYRNQWFNTAYNVITGVIGAAPPGRIVTRSSRLSLAAKLNTPETMAQIRLEFAKATAGFPAPEIDQPDYLKSLDPRGEMAPIPFLLRSQNPQLAENLDRSFAAINASDLSQRFEAFSQIKTAPKLWSFLKKNQIHGGGL